MSIVEKIKNCPSFFAILILVISFGVVIGHGLFTFVYAKGFSYMSNDPLACKNCHVMNQVYESWMKGGHQHVATCNDCHVPHDFIGKWMMKAESGLHHGYAVTFKDNPVSFSATPKSKKIIQNNCMSCHKEYAAHSIDATMKADAPGNEPLNCVSCHRSAGHAHNY
ncbi:MAG: cytochrome c nitrite reductase small subunit [Campylobacter sputorum]|uniref:cytochrome c nitrite reductase small subunit n=1 Tax=Campylobacter sputorum TaxID=206 RepID=UPI000B77A4B2|nr:cytochrome c nitrite reductase small subunit [Campylobacter sputorum]ASM39101.1 formate-dependent nitrite reductase NrfAH, membrane-bound tetraheme cytochrome c subunit [Campylobacter sputorum bv. paraureolyticus LMG 11764]MDY6120143.1 cytochrome c nitrite reductase small subunit [Campylobacter sputorum]